MRSAQRRPSDWRRRSDQEGVFEEHDRRALPHRTVSLPGPSAALGHRRDGSHRNRNDRDRRGRHAGDLAVARSGALDRWPLVLRDLTVATTLGPEHGPGAPGLALRRAAASWSQEPIDPTAQHHLPRKVDRQQKQRRKRHHPVPRGESPGDHVSQRVRHHGWTVKSEKQDGPSNARRVPGARDVRSRSQDLDLEPGRRRLISSDSVMGGAL
jgi:hypothetical protein